jgi:type IV secretion system protein VirB4
LAAGGTFVAVGAEPERLEADDPATLVPGVLAGLCPLADLESGRAQVWAVDWIEGLCALQGLNLAPRARNAVADAVRLLVQSPTRTLTELSASVQDAEVREAMQYYTLGGPAGLLLDADHATPLEGRFRVFELEPLMAQGEKLIVPVLTALFRDIERSLTGAPTLVLIDEAWIALKHPFFRERLRDWLKTLRKMNACVVLATQNLSDIWNSPIRDVVFESCPTKILLPNAEVLHGATRPLYEALGLNSRELELLAQATPKRDYYVTSPLGRRMISFGMGPVSLAFTAANSREDRARAARCRARHGRHWAPAWLAEQGVGDWGRYLGSLQACADFSTHPTKMEGWR